MWRVEALLAGETFAHVLQRASLTAPLAKWMPTWVLVSLQAIGMECMMRANLWLDGRGEAFAVLMFIGNLSA
jgi:hypothetical protein